MSAPNPPRPRRRVAILALVMAGAAAARPLAHEIPMDVMVQALLRPEGRQLQLLARVPMRAMRDVEFPLRGNGTLDLGRADEALRTAAVQWVANGITLYENDAQLPAGTVRAVRMSLPSNRSFGSFDAAAAYMTGPALPADTELPWEQGLLDVWLTYPIHSDRSDFAIRPGLERLGIRVVTVLRFRTPGGIERAFELRGDPGLVRLDPRWHQAALRFVELGFLHILDGLDHLLFLLCLVIPFRRVRPLVLIVTAFTVAHSITLIGSAFRLAPDALWFPPLVETLIAASIVYMALENIVSPGHFHRRWAIAFAFGLVHGFGFSFALRETLQFAGSHLLTSLLSFNVGVELGQLLVLAVLVPALQGFFKYVVAERMGTIVLSALVAHTGWHWMTERLEGLRLYRWPALDPVLLASAGRVVILLGVVAGIAWWAGALRRGGRLAGPFKYRSTPPRP
jgi:hypothetical protein